MKILLFKEIAPVHLIKKMYKYYYCALHFIELYSNSIEYKKLQSQMSITLGYSFH